MLPPLTTAVLQLLLPIFFNFVKIGTFLCVNRPMVTGHMSLIFSLIPVYKPISMNVFMTNHWLRCCTNCMVFCTSRKHTYRQLKISEQLNLFKLLVMKLMNHL